MKAVIYNPPAPCRPFLAVLSSDDGLLLSMAAVESRRAGETLLSEMQYHIAELSHRQ
ncbi:hypothetical protein [Cupriavidus sp. D384]|uniref:hypothetical protein n=1 Tax=Cupriavidus sp. D384 TaxID=1538095 RepID=UPI000AD5B27F|nr:hypothetical protein [Cupriavidus sp. D384]